MSEKKLLYVINHMDWFWSHRLPLAKGAQAQDWDVTVAASGAEKDKKLAEEHFKAAPLPSSSGIAGVLNTIWAIHKVIGKTQPDLIHAITLKYAFMTGLAVRFHRQPLVVFTIAGLGYLFSGEGLKPKILRLLVGPFLKCAFTHKRVHIIFQNPDDQRLMIARGFAKPAQCHLIRGSGVDTDQFLFSAEMPHDIPVVLMPTRLVHEKGIAVFIAAARILKNSGVNAKFQIAGGLTHNNPGALGVDEIKDLTADGTVEWLGSVKNMPELLKNATLIAYPSWYGEGVPKVLLEAASVGRAIVTTDHPGCREAMVHGVNGLLVPIKDAEATAEAIQKLLKDAALRQKMGRAGRALVESEFKVQKIVSETLAVYDF